VGDTNWPPLRNDVVIIASDFIAMSAILAGCFGLMSAFSSLRNSINSLERPKAQIEGSFPFKVFRGHIAFYGR
jgi:hypothetical protein